jgi:hypothetical protein
VLEDFREGGALGGAPMNDDAAVELGLEAARPLLGRGLGFESSGLRRGALATDFDPPELATEVPEALSQNCPKMTKNRTCSKKQDLRKRPKPLI